MSEVVVAKAGGTSNATAEAVAQSLAWAEQSDIFVVSAPGVVAGEVGSKKVTKMLGAAYAEYTEDGYVASSTSGDITARYAEIANGLGSSTMPDNWLNSIRPRIEAAVTHGADAASVLGERLQAEIYQALGFTLLDPGRSSANLGINPDAWRGWLATTYQKGQRYILPGNTTRQGGVTVAIDKGGSDVAGGLTAYGVQADLNINLTDGQAMSADPRLIEAHRLRPIDHMLYAEGRELGRNGTGLVHHAAMVPLMLGNIPTEVRSTFNPDLPATLLDNNHERADLRRGQIIALSLMKDVVIHEVYEPGMADAIGRLAHFDASLAARGVPIIDSQGGGVDSQRYFVDAKNSALAHEALQSAVQRGSIQTIEGIDTITMVGHSLSTRLVDNLVDLIFNSALEARRWQDRDHDLSFGRHSLRLSVDQADTVRVFDRLHAHFLEQ